ncbi:MAG: DPP IV N-terminal domain-containing protein [Planctomycetota bacterium]
MQPTPTPARPSRSQSQSQSKSSNTARAAARLLSIIGLAGMAASMSACQNTASRTVADERTTTDARYITANTMPSTRTPAEKGQANRTPRSGTSFSSVRVEPASPNSTNPYVSRISTDAGNTFTGNTAGNAFNAGNTPRASTAGLSSNSSANVEPGGWTFVSTAANAERATTTNAANRSTNRSSTNAFNTSSNAPRADSNDLTSRMYGDVLGTQLPREADVFDQGKNTANVRQVTFTHTGADFDPAVLRDGSRVVFASTQHRPTADLYIKNADSRTVTRLTDDPAQDVMPAVSPDGRFIAFASDRSGTWDLYLMPIEGGKPVQLTSDNTHDLHPSFSPDGQNIVFSRLGQSSGRWELWVMNIQSPNAVQFVGYGLFPEWSPVPGTGRNGTDQITFQRSRERGDRAFGVWTMDYDAAIGEAGHETEIISAADGALINPSWSPDGEFLLYAEVPAERAGPAFNGAPEQTNIWMIGADGVGRVNLVSGSTIDLMPSWGADNRVYFVSNRSGVENLWAMDMNRALQSASAQRGAIDRRSGTSRPFANVPTEGGTQSQFED